MPQESDLSTAVQVDLSPGLESLFLFDAVESSYPLEVGSGQLPRWLRGSYYVNGPARFERSGMRYRHWLDGDGMICAVHFGEGEPRFLNRFVRTAKLNEEEVAGKAVYRTFGTSFQGDKLRRGVMLEAPMNVSVYPFAGTLLAFGEQSLPVELDPISLETGREYDFHRRLNEVSPFSAHPKFDPATGHMVNFGISFSAEKPALYLYEFDRFGGLLGRRRCPLAYPHSNHDFAISAGYASFFMSPLLMDFSRFWSEGLSVMESLRWEPEKKSYLLVVPRHDKSKSHFSLESGSGHCLHMVNSFEREGKLYVDILELDGPVYPEYQPVPDFYQTKTPVWPIRYVVDLAKREISERIQLEHQYGADFPSLDPMLLTREYKDFWMLGISRTGLPGRKFFDLLIHADWEAAAASDVFHTQPGNYLGGEPIYLANPRDRSRGVVMVQHFDTARNTAEFLLFDAHRVSAGPLASLPLRHKIHPGFHASFWSRELPF